MMRWLKGAQTVQRGEGTAFGGGGQGCTLPVSGLKHLVQIFVGDFALSHYLRQALAEAVVETEKGE